MITDKLSPIVKLILDEQKIDPIPLREEGSLIIRKQFIINALLVATHPKISNFVEKTRRLIGLKHLFEYPYEDVAVNSKSLFLIEDKIDALKKEKLHSEIERFFTEEGRNLQWDVWELPLSICVLTGVLPVISIEPYMFVNFDYYRKEFESIEKIKNSAIRNRELAKFYVTHHMSSRIIFKYPVVVIKQKVRSKDSINRFMETYLPETKGMPEPVFNRIKDINLDKLASSIWLYNRKDWKNKIIVDEINKIEKKDMNFFGDCKRFSAPEFPGLKTELHKHLMSLLPL